MDSVKKLELINAKVEEIISKFEAIGLPRFDFKVEVKTLKSPRYAGFAYRKQPLIELNEIYLRDHFETVLNRTVGHEIAHLYQFKYFPKAKQAHGPEWKRLMVLIGCEPTRCHSMIVPEVQQRKKRKTRYIYSDSTGTQIFHLTKGQHEKFRGHARTKLGTKLTWTGEREFFY